MSKDMLLFLYLIPLVIYLLVGYLVYKKTKDYAVTLIAMILCLAVFILLQLVLLNFK